METVLIGIHGLRNKPPKYLLTTWWKKSIIEGFKTAHLPVPVFDLEMAYWAHFIHERSQNPAIKEQSNPQYLWEPYVPGDRIGAREPEKIGKKISHTLHQQLMQIIAGPSGFMNVHLISDLILHRMFIELDIYYHHELRDQDGRMRPAKEMIRNEIARVIRKHRNKNILILAHSMGTIIAYDVLLHVVPDIPVHTLVTFGSPLGFSAIVNKIKQEIKIGADDQVPLPTPSNIQHKWLNFADPDDVTCMNYNLRYHYAENSYGVRPVDQVVFNNYECNGCANPHKCYGYLRTNEITQALHSFLSLENAGLWQRIKWVFSGGPVI